MNALRILLVGPGGREHALAWRLARDPGCAELHLVPGHEAAERLPGARIRRHAPDSLLRLFESRGFDLVVIGPEGPLVQGVADRLRPLGIDVFGPDRAAAALEGSKWFAKERMESAGVPTARALRVARADELDRSLDAFQPPYVLKADGLAKGKGVLVTRSREDALRFGREALSGERFGEAGSVLVIEEFLEGEEASVMAVCDGERFVLLPAARDYKRAFDGDEGGNTGGMGAFAPASAVTPALEREIGEHIVGPMLREMRDRGTPFRGLLYCGIMLTRSGPKVVEFNVRFGDPEAQVVLPLIEGSLAQLLASASRGALEPDSITRASGASVAVAIVDENYPLEPRGGGRIEGLDALERSGVLVFHSGTERDGDGWRITGGRAAYVVGRGESVDRARASAYDAIATLSGPGWRVRHDIAASRAGSMVAEAGS